MKCIKLMKKLILLVMVSIFSVTMKAQGFEETSLLGQWELTSYQGDYYGFTERDYEAPVDYKYMFIGTLTPTTELPGTSDGVPRYYGEMSGGCFYMYTGEQHGTQEVEPLGIHDFFISNSNKLHIVIASQENVIRFIIEEFNDKELLLKSFDGKCTVVYRRVSDSSSVNSVRESYSTSTVFYDINGVRSSVPHEGINIAVTGDKVCKEVR